MTPTEAALDSAGSDAPIVFEIWRSFQANNSWVSAGKFPSRAAALRAIPNRGRAPGWVVLPVWSRRSVPDAAE
ncbi:MAG TPA: hypothetical protein VGE74_02220 [Gemmata sp.]